MIVTLTPEEIGAALALAKARNQPHLTNKHGCQEGNSQRVHDIGAKAEFAAAKGLCLPYMATVNTFRSQPDLRNLEIRGRSKPWHDLIIRKDDNPDSPYVLVVQESENTFRIVGWIMGKDAQRPEWLASHGGREEAWFVPQKALEPLEILNIC